MKQKKGIIRRKKQIKYIRPHLPFNYLKIYEGYKGPHYNGALVLEFDAPGALFAPADMKLVDYIDDMSGETIILESINQVLYRDKSRAEFVMLLRQCKHNGFVVKDEYKKDETLGYVNASNLYMEITKGQFCGYDYHLKCTTRADNLFTAENMKIVNNGQPIYGGEPIHWDGARFEVDSVPTFTLHKGDLVTADEGNILDWDEKYGDPVVYVDSLDSWMGEDYLYISGYKASLLPSIVADIKEECGVFKALVNGYWIEEERLYDARNKRS